MIQILIVDDHASFRDAMAFMLTHQGDITVTAQAGSLAEARAVLADITVDIALIDLDLPDGQGLELLPDLHTRHPGASAVILTGSIRKESQALAIAAGAVGFLHKSTNIVEIATAIRRLAAGHTLITPSEALALMRQAAQYEARTQATQRAFAQLSRREHDVLRELAAGLDNQGIADRLSISADTVHTHVGRLLRKLEVHSRLQAALLAVRHGVINQDDLG